MKANASGNVRGTGSVNARIREVERRLASGHVSLAVDVAALSRNLREKLTSPLMLLAVAGTGVAIGYFSQRKCAPRSGHGSNSGPPRASRSIFPMLMEGLTLASTIIAMFPRLRVQPTDRAESRQDAI